MYYRFILLVFISFIITSFSCNRNKISKKEFSARYIHKDSLLKNVYFYSIEEIDSVNKFKSHNLPDSIQYPYIYDIEFFLQDIIDYQTNKNNYIFKTDLNFSNPYRYLIIENDTIDDLDSDWRTSLIYEGNANSDVNYLAESTYNGEYFFKSRSDTLQTWNKYFETVKYHNWQMRDYPFDIQKLKFRIKSDFDTSQVRLRASKEFPPSFNREIYLPEGFEIESIDFEEIMYETSAVLIDDLGNETPEITSVGEFTINIKRDGLSLFFKLFLGAILSLILSISVFYIPNGEFDAKSQIAVGALFAAVGNKYFVDSNTISNVLTIADVINNSVIFLVIFNVFIMIAQRSEKLNWKWLEEDKNAVKFSFITMGVIIFSILILYI